MDFGFLDDGRLGDLPDGTGGAGAPVHAPPAGLAGLARKIAADPRFGEDATGGPDCPPELLCLAKAVAYFMLEGMARNATSTVRLPAHCSPSHGSQQMDFGIRDAAVTVAPGATVDVVVGDLPLDWSGYLTGYAWGVTWSADNPGTGDSPFDHAAVTVRANGSVLNGLQPYVGVSRNLGSVGLKVPIRIAAASSAASNDNAAGLRGSRLVLSLTNNHPTESMDALGRIQGWMTPEHGGGGQGAAGALAGSPAG